MTPSIRGMVPGLGIIASWAGTMLTKLSKKTKENTKISFLNIIRLLQIKLLIILAVPHSNHLVPGMITFDLLLPPFFRNANR